VKAFLNLYNRMGDYIYLLAYYMLVAGFRSDNVDQFIKFIGIVATMDWIAMPPLHHGHVAQLRLRADSHHTSRFHSVAERHLSVNFSHV
jgi:hypothetical protein